MEIPEKKKPSLKISPGKKVYGILKVSSPVSKKQTKKNADIPSEDEINEREDIDK